MRSIVLTIVLFLVFAGFAEAQQEAATAPESKVTQTPVSYGLVIDNSGSFRTILEKVIKLASGIIDENNPGDEGFLVTFVDTPKIILRQEITENKAELRDAAENMFIEGGMTAIIDAVKSSADYLLQNAKADPDRPRALILITDGDERKSSSQLDEVLKTLKASKIKVFVIAIAEEKIYPKVIDRLTKETGGTKYMPKTRDELTAAIKSVSTAVRAK